MKDRARIFALYWGCKYSYKNEWGTYSDVVGSFHWMDHVKQGAKLHLKELSTITAEDKYELSKILFPKSENWHDNMQQPVHVESFLDSYSDEEDIEIFALKNPMQKIISANDFLRSKSYALPFEGANLFEQSIAVKPAQ